MTCLPKRQQRHRNTHTPGERTRGRTLCVAQTVQFSRSAGHFIMYEWQVKHISRMNAMEIVLLWPISATIPEAKRYNCSVHIASMEFAPAMPRSSFLQLRERDFSDINNSKKTEIFTLRLIVPFFFCCFLFIEFCRISLSLLLLFICSAGALTSAGESHSLLAGLAADAFRRSARNHLIVSDFLLGFHRPDLLFSFNSFSMRICSLRLGINLK